MEFQVNQDVQWQTHPSLLKAANAISIELQHRYVTPKEVLRARDGIEPYHTVGRQMRRREQLIFDFGQHLVGQVTLSLDSLAVSPPDAPVKLHLQFGERQFEVMRDFSTYCGEVSASWLQESLITVDVLPAEVTLPRRFAFRYVKVTLIDTSPKFDIRLRLACRTQSAVDERRLIPLETGSKRLGQIDEIAQRTLAACMQEVFEDGPKRDRRLWMGDLHLQALANSVTFDHRPLVERCLYQFAAITRADGLIAANVFTEPRLIPDDTFLLDYSLFFVDTLRDYYRHTKARHTLVALYPTAKRQVEIVSQYLDQDGRLNAPAGWSAFIDWSDTLDKQLALQGVMINSCRAMIELAQAVEDSDMIKQMEEQIAIMTQWAQARFSPSVGCFVTESNQRSQHSQVWLAIAGVGTLQQRQQALSACLTQTDMVQCATPYMMHYLVVALFESDMQKQAMQVLESYWGEMLDAGADTFWEAFSPTDPDFSPYGDRLANSFCHAWSCTPCYLLRHYHTQDKMNVEAADASSNEPDL